MVIIDFMEWVIERVCTSEESVFLVKLLRIERIAAFQFPVRSTHCFIMAS